MTEVRTYLIVTVTATIAAAAAVVSLARTSRSLPRSWQVLGYSGVPLALGGIGFVLRFWHPTEGPYVANRVYPFGSHLNACAVSFGFLWLAFGVVHDCGSPDGTSRNDEGMVSSFHVLAPCVASARCHRGRMILHFGLSVFGFVAAGLRVVKSTSRVRAA
jgi:hypothetical protein